MLSEDKKHELYDIYSKDKVDDVINLMHYKKGVEPLPKEESGEHPTIYIFRHGQTTDNKDMIFSGWRDVDLTEEGIKQAEILADKLKNKKIDMLIASDQIRAIHTLEIAISKNKGAKNLEIHTDKRIKERGYGDLEGSSKLEMKLKDPELTKKYRRSFDTPPPNGESIGMVAKRVAEFCDEIVPLMKEHNLNVAISCHGNSIRGFRRYFEGLSDEETASVETPLGQDYAAYAIK